MSESEPKLLAPPSRPLNLWVDGLILTGLLVVGFFGAQIASVLAVFGFADNDLGKAKTYLSNFALLGDPGRILLLSIQGATTVMVFILPPVILVRWVRKQSLWTLSPTPIKDVMELLWAILLIPALAPLLELTIAWNKSLRLPAWLQGMERWMQAKESGLEELTKYMINFTSFDQFLLGLFVIAVLAAVGEELLFRGTIQPMIQKATGSPHRAIWITAILFSAIHMQFYGFVPRMLLGALFGYLYYWSGNLSIPILAHFTNNGITVSLSYLSQQGQTNLDPDNLPDAPLYVLLLSAAAGAAVLYRFRATYARSAQNQTLP